MVPAGTVLECASCDKAFAFRGAVPFMNQREWSPVHSTDLIWNFKRTERHL